MDSKLSDKLLKLVQLDSIDKQVKGEIEEKYYSSTIYDLFKEYESAKDIKNQVAIKNLIVNLIVAKFIESENTIFDLVVERERMKQEIKRVKQQLERIKRIIIIDDNDNDSSNNNNNLNKENKKRVL
jgi:hypothetical protein